MKTGTVCLFGGSGFVGRHLVTRFAARGFDIKLLTRSGARHRELLVLPAVNIIETEEGLTLTADIPGASKEALDVNIEKGILTINAPVSRSMPGNPVYTEFELASYYRQFSIPESLDHEKAKAHMANGIPAR